jgi:hypothetical protein
MAVRPASNRENHRRLSGLPSSAWDGYEMADDGGSANRMAKSQINHGVKAIGWTACNSLPVRLETDTYLCFLHAFI